MAIFAMPNNKKAGRRSMIIPKLIETVKKLEEGWCYTVGTIIRASGLKTRDVYYQIQKVKQLGLVNEIYIPIVNSEISLLCKGNSIKGVKIINRQKIITITTEQVKKYIERIVASMKSKIYHMRASAVIREFGISQSLASILAIAYLMWLVDNNHFAGLVRPDHNKEPKIYFLFVK